MDKQFHVLGRNSAGGLTTASKQYLKESGVNLQLTTAKTASAAAVIQEFRKTLPKSVTLPEASPFLILRAVRPIRRGGVVAACQCQCSVTSNCGGGGGGS